MKDERLEIRIPRALNAELSGLRTSPMQREQLRMIAAGGKRVKRKWTVGLVLTIMLVLVTLTALAVTLLSGTEVIELFAVPMALDNDGEGYTQESYSHEELAELLEMLQENGITLAEDSSILQALENGQGYWEEELLMEICRQAFGGLFYEWTVEQKQWFDTMTVRIGFKEKNPYLVPEEGDMTVQEAKAYAAKLLREYGGVELPVQSDDQWKLCEWFYAPWTDTEGFHPAMWKFEYINRRSGTEEYTVRFDRDGGNVQIEEAAFHHGPDSIVRFEDADQFMTEKYGAMPYWPVEAWPEFAGLIAALTPESANQWGYQHAGYCLPPEGALPVAEAIRITQEAAPMQGTTEANVICCTVGGHALYKVMLRIHVPGNEGNAAYDLVWLAELDCMTGEIVESREWYGGMPSLACYVPFEIVRNVPVFSHTPTEEEQARILEKQRQADAYHAYEQTYGEMWYFWPLEAQRDALGAPHHVPEGEEMTREAAVQKALAAVADQKGEGALAALGDYRVGVICCRLQETEGIRISWEVYITSDPVMLSNGYRVDFDDPCGLQAFTDVIVLAANAENG